MLPARLGDTGDEPIGRQLAEGDTREFEAAKESATATCYQAAVREANRARITGKLAEANVIFLCLELGTEFRPLRHGSAFAFVSFKP